MKTLIKIVALAFLVLGVLYLAATYTPAAAYDRKTPVPPGTVCEEFQNDPADIVKAATDQSLTVVSSDDRAFTQAVWQQVLITFGPPPPELLLADVNDISKLIIAKLSQDPGNARMAFYTEGGCFVTAITPDIYTFNQIIQTVGTQDSI